MYAMGEALGLWFMYLLVVNAFAAYVAGRALPPGADYLHVFRVVGTAAFLGFSAALWQLWVWYNRSLGTTLPVVGGRDHPTRSISKRGSSDTSGLAKKSATGYRKSALGQFVRTRAGFGANSSAREEFESGRDELEQTQCGV